MADHMAKGLELLDQAIKMHQTHLDDPKTATTESQKEMMALMVEAKKAFADHQEEMDHLAETYSKM